ncbi:MAG: hypothetical protein ABL994_03190 [Verrucomicrobiales bacterium]
MNETSFQPFTAQPAGIIVPVPPEHMMENPALIPAPAVTFYRSGNHLVIEHGASIPTEWCIKSGRPVYKVIEVSLRNPANPKSWFGSRPVIEVGLCRKHYEDHTVAVALTWSVLALGFILLAVGILAAGMLSSILGVIAIAGSGFFRATSPVTSPDATNLRATVFGAGEGYLKHLPDDQR